VTRAVFAIARRELASYFSSPLAYVVTALFLVLAGLFFSLTVINVRQATLRPVLQNLYTIMLLLTPALTMRLLSEEQRTGTMELLLTAPIRELDIVIGKFLAGIGFFAVMISLTLIHPLFLAIYGSPDQGSVLSGYVGVILFGAAIVAIGLFTSSLTPNPMIAYISAFVILLVLWVIDNVGSLVGGDLGAAITYTALFPHFNDLTRGLIDTKDVVYFVSLAAAALFLTWRSLEARRWRA